MYPWRLGALPPCLSAPTTEVRSSLSPYGSLYGDQSPDFVLMLLPIEPAFALALQNDEALYQNAREIAERLDQTQEYYTVRKRLRDGRGNPIRQVEMLRELGAGNDRELPESLDNPGS